MSECLRNFTVSAVSSSHFVQKSFVIFMKPLEAAVFLSTFVKTLFWNISFSIIIKSSFKTQTIPYISGTINPVLTVVIESSLEVSMLDTTEMANIDTTEMANIYYCYRLLQVYVYTRPQLLLTILLLDSFLRTFQRLILIWISIRVAFKHPAHIWATSWENLILPCANNKGADQPAHPRSLISTFVVRFLDSVIHVLATSEISRLACFCRWAGQFESYLVENPKDRLSRDVAYLSWSMENLQKCALRSACMSM